MQPTIPTQPALPSRRLRWLARTARLALWLLGTAWLMFGLAWLVIHGWIVPRIGEFRPRLEGAASKALKVPVRIGQITARSQGLLPEFELTDVSLLDARGQVALRLPKVSGVLSPASLWSLGFQQLVIENPELDVRRAADGRFFIAGLPASARDETGGDTATDWLFSQPELVIRGGTIRWTDELRQAPTLALTNVDWVLRNTRQRHAMRFDATPPADWGGRFTLRGIFRQPLLSRHAGQFDVWSGQLYGEVARADLTRIRQYVDLDKLGVKLSSGNGALRAWADVDQGQLTGGLADVALLGVNAQLGKQLEPLAFTSISGRIGGARRADGFDLNLESLRFVMQDGLQWPGGNIVLSHTDREGRREEHTEITADKLDLAALALIARRLPLGGATHSMIDSFSPSGLVETLKARWQGPMAAPVTYAASGRATALSLAAGPAGAPVVTGQSGNKHETPGRPGLIGAEVDFEMTQAGGRAQISISGGSLDFPGVFEDARIPFTQLSTEASWKITGQSIEAKLRNLQFANADAEGQAQVSWKTGDAAAATPSTAPATIKPPVPAGPATASSAAVKAGALVPRDTRFPGVLDLQGSLSRGNGARVHRYLPVVLAEPVRRYVRDAVTAGDVSDVKFRVKGPVEWIPFSNPALGEFRITAKVRSGQYAYVPKFLQPANAAPWPALIDVDGELVFMRAALEVNNASARVAGLPGLQVVKASAKIPDLLKNATVDVGVDVKGPLTDALGFVNTSPLAAITSQALEKTIVSGAADYRFRLSLPINAINNSRVEGSITLPGNDVQFVPEAPPLENLKGTVAVNERGFSVSSGQARLLGGDIRFEGGTQPAGPAAQSGADSALVFRGQGTLSAEGLRQFRPQDFAAKLAQNATGSAAYDAVLGFRKGRAEITVTSNLQGMGLSLPAPLAKSADSLLPVRFENSLLSESIKPGQPLQDRLVLNIGNLAAIHYLRDLSGEQPRVIRGSIGVGLEPGEAAQTPDNGVAANIQLARVDLDAWGKILNKSGSTTLAAGSLPVTAPGVTGTVPSAGVTAARDRDREAERNREAAAASLGYLPTVLAIRAKELKVEGRQLNNVVVGGTRDGLTWRANISAAELNGYVEFRQPGSDGAGRVYARLARLSLAPGTASDVEAMLDEQPANIPALDIIVDDLELRGRKLGRIEIDAVNRSASPAGRDGARDSAREWRLNKFNVTLPEAVLTASGNWAAPAVDSAVPAAATRGRAERRRTQLNFKLDVTDSGELLKRFGMADVIRRGKGRLEGQVGWTGSPLSVDYPSLGGQFNVEMESGQFVKADPGIAKLLGVLSLQSLPRRLTLDFRDVFSEGFAFDFVRGDVAIDRGIAQTNNLQMKGVNAAVLMEGNADISRETQDLQVVVIPEIDAGTALLIATVINPAIGLGTFLAQMFLRRPLMEAATQQFDIKGTWTDPKIIKVDRRAPADSAPAARKP